MITHSLCYSPKFGKHKLRDLRQLDLWGLELDLQETSSGFPGAYIPAV